MSRADPKPLPHTGSEHLIHHPASCESTHNVGESRKDQNTYFLEGGRGKVVVKATQGASLCRICIAKWSRVSLWEDCLRKTWILAIKASNRSPSNTSFSQLLQKELYVNAPHASWDENCDHEVEELRKVAHRVPVTEALLWPAHCTPKQICTLHRRDRENAVPNQFLSTGTEEISSAIGNRRLLLQVCPLVTNTDLCFQSLWH